MNGPGATDRAPRRRLALWLAQGFGLGRLPRAPGTWGSVGGLVWCAILLATGSIWVYLAGVVGGFLGAVWCSGVAAKLLNQPDPPSVVLDEIVAVPLCFATWLGLIYAGRGDWPSARFFLEPGAPLRILGVFLLFRFFDVLKPWPVRQSQALPGGWGISLDDTLAAGYVNLVVAAVALLESWLATGPGRG